MAEEAALSTDVESCLLLEEKSLNILEGYIQNYKFMVNWRTGATNQDTKPEYSISIALDVTHHQHE